MGEESEEDCDSPSSVRPAKRVRLTQTDLLNLLLNEVTEIRTCMNTRLTLLENKVSVLVHTCNKISSRLDAMEHLATTTAAAPPSTTTSTSTSSTSTTTTTTTSSSTSTSSSASSKQPDQNVGMDIGMEVAHPPVLVQDTEASTQMNVVTLNTEADFPHGSWLGDPQQPNLRIRCPITPQNMLHINSTCVTAEKMALTLLDYLFTKDELATSNLSGRSRWNKKQLDPLMMFGIRCHLQYKFNITSKLWGRIRRNMDSKCRSAWKRRIRSLVTQPSHKQRPTPEIGHTSSVRKDPAVTEDISFDFDSLQNSNLDLSDVKVITQSSTCELRILNATPEEISELQDTQEIILSEEQILATPSSEKSILISSSSPSVAIGGEGLGGELDIGSSPSLASIDHSDHRIALKSGPGLTILDQHGILARDSETDD